MRIYISGPITGRTPEEVQAAFGAAADMIKAEGNTPINPAGISGWELPWADYMTIAEIVLTRGKIDAVYMLEGWGGSRGARLERMWALSMGKPVYYEEKTKAKIQDPGDTWYRENFVEKYDDGKSLIEDIITGAGGAYEDADAVEEYKRGLVIQLNAWALEEREKDTAAWLKPAPLLQRVAEKIEWGEL